MIYQPTPPKDTLEQGDVLEKTPALVDLIGRYHPYYANHPDNKFFVVLTQSCDLVLRNTGCSARYISLAPVRPLKVVLRREFDGKLSNVGVGAQPFATKRTRSGLEQFLHRLFNNNEAPFFYYEAEHGSGIYDDMCAMLALPISLKPEHYATLVGAKVAGIHDVFQAKLGWLLGQMYSRVGTPDLAESARNAKVSNYLDGVASWLEDADTKSIASQIKQFKATNNNAVVGPSELASMISKIPKRKNQTIDAVLNAAHAQGLIEDQGPKRKAFRKALENCPDFGAQFPR